MTTVHDVILNAEYNLTNNGLIGMEMAKLQLQTVVAEIEKGKDLHDEIDEE